MLYRDYIPLFPNKHQQDNVDRNHNSIRNTGRSCPSHSSLLVHPHHDQHHHHALTSSPPNTKRLLCFCIGSLAQISNTCMKVGKYINRSILGSGRSREHSSPGTRVTKGYVSICWSVPHLSGTQTRCPALLYQNSNLSPRIYWGYIGIMEKKMETTVLLFKGSGLLHLHESGFFKPSHSWSNQALPPDVNLCATKDSRTCFPYG